MTSLCIQPDAGVKGRNEAAVPEPHAPEGHADRAAVPEPHTPGVQQVYTYYVKQGSMLLITGTSILTTADRT